MNVTKKKMNKVGLLFVLAGTLAFAGCKQTGEYTQPVAEYATMKVAPVNKTLSASYPATIRGRQDIQLFPQVGGFITQLCIEEGQRVRKGQVLFIIDQVPYQAALATARANVEAADAGVATAQLTFDSKKELFANNIISSYELNTAENNLRTAKAVLSQAKAQELAAANNLSYTEVKSPSDGVIGTLPYRTGALVSATMPQPLTTVSDNSEMYVYFSMTENQLLGLVRQYGSKEKALQAMPGIELQLNDLSMYGTKGIIETISGVIDPSTGTVSVRGMFPNRDGLLHSGSAGNVVLPTEYKDGLVIPRSATFEVQDKMFVYLVKEGKTHAAQISVERVKGGQDYIVKDGLTAGDEIVAEGVGLLQDGMPITVKKNNN